MYRLHAIYLFNSMAFSLNVDEIDYLKGKLEKNGDVRYN